jgi:AraC family transcriptional activator of mtrCDE
VDWLSSVLDLAPVRGQLDLRCLYGAPWRIDQGPSGESEIPYHVVLEGTAYVEDPAGGARQRLDAGDMLLIVENTRHVLRDGSGRRPVAATERRAQSVVISENRAGGERLDLLCGHFILTKPHERLLRAYLPPRLVIRRQGADAGATQSPASLQMMGLIELMRRESDVDSIGGRAMLNAFSAALFALALRFATESGQIASGLLALAAYPRLAPALTAMFREPAGDWTLPRLARLCGMSRATFARHLGRGMGRSAHELLLDIRMTLATTELKKPTASTSAVAEMVGYQSEAAFQRAFKRHAGVTPAGWRRG